MYEILSSEQRFINVYSGNENYPLSTFVIDKEYFEQLCNKKMTIKPGEEFFPCVLQESEDREYVIKVDEVQSCISIVASCFKEWKPIKQTG